MGMDESRRGSHGLSEVHVDHRWYDNGIDGRAYQFLKVAEATQLAIWCGACMIVDPETGAILAEYQRQADRSVTLV
jgi:hypothetical protein